MIEVRDLKKSYGAVHALRGIDLSIAATGQIIGLLGLAAEIEHVRDTLAAAGIDTTIEARPIALAPAQESALTMALREAATNVIRHAAATKCHTKFYAQDGSALMEVQDDGRGSDAPFGNGLSGMSERIHALGGALERESERGRS